MYRSVLCAALLVASTATLTAQTTPDVPSFELGNYGYSIGGNGTLVEGDFNNDGKPDFMIAGASNTTYGVTFFAGNGDGTFKAPQPIGAADSQIQDMAVADFNNDGNLDIVTFNLNNSFDVFYGNGNGTFQAPIVFATAAYPNSGAVGSFYGDGYTDIAVADNNGNIEVFRNEGGKSFVLTSTIPVISQGSGFFMRLRGGDVNGNGITALGALTTQAAYAIWADGKGNFTKAMLKSYANPADLSIGAVTQDGQADIIVSYSCAEAGGESKDPSTCAGLDVFYGQGNNQTFYRNAVTDSNDPAPSQPIAADVNGDGIADLVASDDKVGGGSGGMYVWLGHPDGSFNQTPQIYMAGDNGPMTAGDWNRDGMMDLVQYRISDGSMEVYLNAGPRGACQTSQVSPTVTECMPVDNTYLPGPNVAFEANAYDRNQVTSMQLYANGYLEYSGSGATFNKSFALGDGYFYLVTKAWDATGLSFRSVRHLNVYNGTPGPTCPAASGTANICLPSSSTSSSPVEILANGATAYIPTSAQLYVDGNLVVNNKGYCYDTGSCVGGTSFINTSQNLSIGSHSLVFKLWDANGNVYTAQKTITVN